MGNIVYILYENESYTHCICFYIFPPFPVNSQLKEFHYNSEQWFNKSLH